MELPVERHPEGGQAEDDEVPRTGGGLLVRHEGYPGQLFLSLISIDLEIFKGRPKQYKTF